MVRSCRDTMTVTPSIQSTLTRYHSEILAEMRAALQRVSDLSSAADPYFDFYHYMRYHLGWVDAAFAPVSGNPGKLLRPTLLLLAYEAAGANRLAEGAATDTAHLARALPAAAALEFTHNFTLIHDDIVDDDVERRHRATLWKLWGVPQAINAGDGMFALARLALWGVLERGVEPRIAVKLGALLDYTSMVIAEGQYLDISFEERRAVSVAAYFDMIRRKTAVLMACAAEMGALLGTGDQETIASLRSFGEAIGTAFQVRDDILGVWASTAESGKTAAGDIYRRKKSLPILHALEHASPADRQRLLDISSQEQPLTSGQVDGVLSIFERTQTQTYCRDFLAAQCRLARAALASVPRLSQSTASRALDDMEALVRFVEEAVSS